MTYLLAPLVASLPRARVEITFTALIGELAVGLVYGLSLALLNEMLLFAGQIAGVVQLSLVNLIDPSSHIETPLLGDLFQLMETLVLIASGLDHILLASLVRSFRAVPLGTYVLARSRAWRLRAAGGVFLAGVELAAPVLAATMLLEIAVALLGELSPQLPVMSPHRSHQDSDRIRNSGWLAGTFFAFHFFSLCRSV